MEKTFNLPEKRYYTIGEVAKYFGMNPSKIRFWEKEFDFLSPQKNTKGTRRYTPSDVKKIQMIYHLVEEKGHTLEGARGKIKELQKKNFSQYEVVERLQRIKKILLNIKSEL